MEDRKPADRQQPPRERTERQPLQESFEKRWDRANRRDPPVADTNPPPERPPPKTQTPSSSDDAESVGR